MPRYYLTLYDWQAAVKAFKDTEHEHTVYVYRRESIRRRNDTYTTTMHYMIRIHNQLQNPFHVTRTCNLANMPGRHEILIHIINRDSVLRIYSIGTGV
jgi:hypothetical protein